MKDYANNVISSFSKYFRSYVELLIPIIQQGIDNGKFLSVNTEESAIAAGVTFECKILLWVYDPKAVDHRDCYGVDALAGRVR
ncbi:hypothetical protein ACFLV7_07245 [Chloroflexota bacterium]